MRVIGWRVEVMQRMPDRSRAKPLRKVGGGSLVISVQDFQGQGIEEKIRHSLIREGPHQVPGTVEPQYYLPL